MIRVASSVIPPIVDQVPDEPAHTLWLDPRPGWPPSWSGVRNLLAQVTVRRGRAAVDGLLTRRRVAVSLLLDRFEPTLTAAERKARELLVASPQSHLTHNWTRQAPLFDAWAELLADLLCTGGFRLLVTDLSRLDWESIAVLKALFRRPDAVFLDLDLNWPSPEEPAVPDGDGILWRLDRRYLERSLLDFLSIPGSCRVAAPRATSASSAGAAELTSLYPEPEAHLEGEAFALLAASRGPLSTADGDLALRGVEAAFRRFGFASALRLGRELANRRPPLAPLRSATLHGLVALSAHNLQFHAGGNQSLAAFIERHLRAALALETRPAHRAALLYRLAVTLGRRRGDFDAAEAAADEALAVAVTLPPPIAAYHECWARNIRAYARARAGRKTAAVTDLAISLRRLPSAEAAGGDPSRPAPREVAFTRALVATNLAALALAAGDHPAALYWRRVAYDLERRQSGRGRYEAIAWIDGCRTLQLIRHALPQALRGWASARRDNDGTLLHRFAAESADLSYRLGRLPAAVRWYRRAHRLREAAGAPSFLPEVAADAAVACGRAGLVEEAASLLRSTAFRHPSRPAQAEIQARLALAAVRGGQPAAADTARRRALEVARRHGSDTLLLQILAASGRTLQLLARPEDARRAYVEAIALTPTGPFGSEVASAVLRTLLGLAETGGDPGGVGRALAMLPAALAERETWWLLRRLLTALAGGHGLVRRSVDVTDLEPLRLLLLASDQRPDCAEARHRLLSASPEAGELGPTRPADVLAELPEPGREDVLADPGSRPWAWAREP